MIKKCLICNKEYSRSPSNIGKYCSRKCFLIGRKKLWNDRKNQRDISYMGNKRIDNQGYIRIYMPRYPSSDKQGYILEHRFVMGQILNRPLTKDEKVHHKNGIRDDNRPENLHLYIQGKNWHSKFCPFCGFHFSVK